MKKTITILFILFLSLIASNTCPVYAKSPDIDGSGIADFNDYALLANQWLNSSEQEPNIPQGWPVRYNDPNNVNDYATDIITDISGNIYVTGYSNLTVYNSDYVTIKYDPNGNQIWIARYDGPANGDDRAAAITIDSSGNTYVTGFSEGVGTNYDYATVKYDPNGTLVWVARFNGTGNDWDVPYAMTIDTSGYIYVTGCSTGIGTYYDYTTVKYDSDGNQLWAARYNGAGNWYDEAYAIITDNSGNAYVTGYSSSSTTSKDYTTIKYNTNGTTLWIARYNGTGSSSNYAYAITRDNSGNIFVTGESQGSGTNYDYATIKYNSSGTKLWTARYNGTNNTTDAARAIMADDYGNVYVTGQSWGLGTYYDYVTIKYSSIGTQLWMDIYNKTGASEDCAKDITKDNFGNIYVTGYSYASGYGTDYTTIKYDPNGNRIWLKEYNNGNDSATAITSDTSGNIYVTGQSSDLVTKSDFATIKYAQDLICQTEFDGDLNGDCTVDIYDLTLFCESWLDEQ